MTEKIEKAQKLSTIKLHKSSVFRKIVKSFSEMYISFIPYPIKDSNEVTNSISRSWNFWFVFKHVYTGIQLLSFVFDTEFEDMDGIKSILELTRPEIILVRYM
jgi:hypothetical protein